MLAGEPAFGGTTCASLLKAESRSVTGSPSPTLRLGRRMGHPCFVMNPQVLWNGEQDEELSEVP